MWTMNSAAAAPGVTSTSSGADARPPAAIAARSAGPAEVVAVHQDEVVELDAEVAQRRVGDRALGQVEPDPVVPELLGRLGLDRHPAVVHASSRLVSGASV